MTIPFAVYRTSDGVIIRTGIVPDEAHVAIQAQDGEAVSTSLPDTLAADGLWAWNGTTFVQNAPPSPTLAQVQAQALASLAKIKTVHADLYAAPTGGLQTDTNSRVNLSGAALMAKLALDASAPFSIEWIMADNTVQTFTTAASFIAMSQAAGEYYSAVVRHANGLREAILAATTTTAVAAIDLTTGWPT